MLNMYICKKQQMRMNSLILPPYLSEGDKVAIVSPSSKIDKSFLKGAKKRLESWGLKVVTGKYAGASSVDMQEQ